MIYSIIQNNNIIPIKYMQHTVPTQLLESREKKWILIGLLRSVPEKSSLNLTLWRRIALAHSVCLLNILKYLTPKT